MAIGARSRSGFGGSPRDPGLGHDRGGGKTTHRGKGKSSGSGGGKKTHRGHGGPYWPPLHQSSRADMATAKSLVGGRGGGKEHVFGNTPGTHAHEESIARNQKATLTFNLATASARPRRRHFHARATQPPTQPARQQASHPAGQPANQEAKRLIN